MRAGDSLVERHARVALGSSERRRPAAEFRAADIELLSIASYVRVADGSVSDQECLAGLRAHCALAHDLCAAAVRVFPGAAEPSSAAGDRAVRRLNEAARTSPVRLLPETHDSHPRARDVARVLERVAHPAVGASWDVRHTWLAEDHPDESAELLRLWLDLVQLTDVPGRHDRTPVLPGKGALPLAEVMSALRTVGYHGPCPWSWRSAGTPAAHRCWRHSTTCGSCCRPCRGARHVSAGLVRSAPRAM